MLARQIAQTATLCTSFILVFSSKRLTAPPIRHQLIYLLVVVFFVGRMFQGRYTTKGIQKTSLQIILSSPPTSLGVVYIPLSPKLDFAFYLNFPLLRILCSLSSVASICNQPPETMFHSTYPNLKQIH